MRTHVTLLGWVCSLVIPLCLSDGARAAESRRPNVVMIVADDLGLQLGCYGDRVARTPHVDALAADGTRFTRAYCTTASCSASRSVILSGLYNHATGHYGHAHGDGHFSSYDSVQSLPVILNEAGYRTCLIGKYHLAPEYVYRFETQRQAGTQGHRNTVRMAANARDWISEKDERPFFLYFCPTDPHRAGDASRFANHHDQPDFYPEIKAERFQPADIQVPSWLPDLPEVRQELAEYYQAVARFDAGIGALVQALKETGHYENTLIMLLSDNGPPFPGAKTTAYEPGINLPLIVRDPRQSQRGNVCEAMVSWVDLVPTVLDYCQVPNPVAPPLRPAENVGPATKAPEKPALKTPQAKLRPYEFQGRSFAAVIDEKSPEGWNELQASHTFHEITMYYPMRVVREGQYKYIRNLAHQLPYPFASDLHASPTWQAVLKRQDPQAYYGRRSVDAYVQRAAEELYDLTADSHETRNLANDPAMSPVLEKLRAKMQKWQAATKDPWVTKWEYE